MLSFKMYPHLHMYARDYKYRKILKGAPRSGKMVNKLVLQIIPNEFWTSAIYFRPYAKTKLHLVNKTLKLRDMTNVNIHLSCHLK